MAKRYDVELTRTTVETFKATVEASTEREAAFRAAQVAPEWQPKSTSVDLAKVQWKDGGEG
jgi:hypothetical protein